MLGWLVEHRALNLLEKFMAFMAFMALWLWKKREL